MEEWEKEEMANLRLLSGCKYRELGELYGISPAQAGQICRQMRQKWLAARLRDLESDTLSYELAEMDKRTTCVFLWYLDNMDKPGKLVRPDIKEEDYMLTKSEYLELLEIDAEVRTWTTAN